MKRESIWIAAENAYACVPVYNNMLKIETVHKYREEGKFSRLPVIDRNIMVRGQSGSIAPEYCIDYMQGRLMRQRTSGSTGKYLEIVWNPTDYEKSMIELWLWRAKFYGIYPHNRLFYFFTQNNVYENEVIRKYEYGVCKNLLTLEGLDRIYDRIIEWNPEWMILQPSSAVILCEYIKNRKKEIPDALRYIEFSGEILSPEIRKMTKDTFKCFIADQYGSNEFNSIAYECPEGKFHILNHVYMEILSDDGNVLCTSDMSDEENSEEIGRIVISSSDNKAMPFIRYDIGDRGRILKNRKCKCGCDGALMELMSGRKSDFILFEDGSKTSPYIFIQIFDRINIVTDGAVMQFYIEQTDYGNFRIVICIDRESDEDYISKLFMQFIDEEHLKHSKYVIVYVDYINMAADRSKYFYFRNLIRD